MPTSNSSRPVSQVQWADEADPFRLTLSNWQLWVIAGSLAVLALGACITMALLDGGVEESGAFRVSFALGVPMLVLAGPGVLLLIALLASKPATRARLFTAGAVILGGFTAMYVPAQALAILGHNVTAGKERYEAARVEVKGIIDSTIGPANELSKQLLNVGGLNPKSLHSEKEIDARLALVRRLRKSNDETIAKLGVLDAQVNAVFDKHGVSQEARTKLWKSSSEAEAIALGRRLRELDRDIYKQAEAYLSILRDQFGHWDVAGNGVVTFDYDEARISFNSTSQRLFSLDAEEQALIAGKKK